MRKILFKAKTKEEPSVWYYGLPMDLGDGIWELKFEDEYGRGFVVIQPETICQWICNLNGQDFFEGDIVQQEVIEYDHEVQMKDGMPGYVIVEKDRYFLRSVLIYEGTGFHIRDEEHDWAGVSNWNWNELTVVGNLIDDKDKFKDLLATRD